MKKTLLFSLAALVLSTASAQSTPSASTPAASSAPSPATQAAYGRVAGEFRDLYNGQQADSLFALYSPRIKGMLPLAATKQMISRLQAQFGNLQSVQLVKQDTGLARYTAKFDKATLTMILALDKEDRIDGLRFVPYQPEPTAAASAGDSSNVTLKTARGTIYGTLQVPKGDKKVPVVLIIAGSGPTDRDGNALAMGLHTDMYKILADSLLQRGIASLRYDKRGIGASSAAGKSESMLSFEDMIDDAAGFVKMLKADNRFSKVIVLGHSEGSLIGMIAAGRDRADAFISLAGAGDRIDKIIERQLAAQSPALAARATVIFDSLGSGYRVQDVGTDLMSLFRPSVQPYMISWLKYNPQSEIEKLYIPVLIIQGTTDLQTSVQDAESLKAANPRATLEVIDGMNHVFRQTPTSRQENLATYANPALPLQPELIKAIVRLTIH